METIKERLAYLRNEIENECISTGEIMELQSLSQHIDRGDVLLLEWAGVPEHEGVNHDLTCDECGKTATRNIQGCWVEYSISDAGSVSNETITDVIEGMNYFYCDDCN